MLFMSVEQHFAVPSATNQRRQHAGYRPPGVESTWAPGDPEKHASVARRAQLGEAELWKFGR